ncbi:hypothetical protein ES708_03322 [subsurface metagenome]
MRSGLLCFMHCVSAAIIHSGMLFVILQAKQPAMKKSFARLFFLSLVFILCAAPTMNFNVMLPSAISFPDHIKSVAMIDRTMPDDNVLNVIEGGLTGEMIGEDKLATQILMDGVHSIMVNSATLDFIRTPEVLEGASSVSAAFPAPLDWETINNLCSKYRVDAILAIEIFDSDFIIIPGAGQTVTVKTGIRMYDPATKNIIDQYVFSHQMGIGGSINTLEAALGSLMNKNTAIREVSYDAGVIYGRRISPYWYRVSRDYYRKSKGDHNLAEGARMMEVNDWDAARAALQRAVDTSKKRKTRGRAAHNLAVVYEIEGNLPEAKSWAQAAWGKYKNKKSRDYLYDINHRINQMQILEQQLD